QEPVFDNFKKSHIFWVGLSAVLFEADEKKLPLSSITPSGKLIHSIEAPFRKRFSFYKTNLVKCAPLNGDRVRYPSGHEMEKCYPNLESELDHLNPKTVFLLGRQVTNFVVKKLNLPNLPLDENFRYEMFQANGINFVPAHHPSYILVYKRKYIEQYV